MDDAAGLCLPRRAGVGSPRPGCNTVRSYSGVSINCLVLGSSLLVLEAVNETIESAEIPRITIELRKTLGAQVLQRIGWLGRHRSGARDALYSAAESSA